MDSGDCLGILGNVFILATVLLFTGGILVSMKCFKFWEKYQYNMKSFLDSGDCFVPMGYFPIRGTTSVDHWPVQVDTLVHKIQIKITIKKKKKKKHKKHLSFSHDLVLPASEVHNN